MPVTSLTHCYDGRSRLADSDPCYDCPSYISSVHPLLQVWAVTTCPAGSLRSKQESMMTKTLLCAVLLCLGAAAAAQAAAPRRLAAAQRPSVSATVVMFGWPDWKIDPSSNSSKCIEQVRRVATRLGIGPDTAPGRRSRWAPSDCQWMLHVAAVQQQHAAGTAGASRDLLSSNNAAHPRFLKRAPSSPS
jgi:hypothetical protein